MHEITVIGAGFAALTAVRHLRREAPEAEITLVAPRAELLYAPSLIWIPSGLRRGEDLRIPLRPYLDRLKVKFHAGRVSGLSEGGRRVHTDRGDLHNDGLLIASGGRFLKKLPGIEHALTLCEGVEAAEAIRDRLARLDGGTLAFGFGSNPREPSAMRGGPMFELLFGIDTLLRRQRRREAFRLVFFNPAPQPGKRLGERAVKGLLREMRRRDIDTHLGHKLLGFDADRVRTEGGEFEADLILFMPGMTGPDWAADSGLALSAGGFFRADAHCRVADAERVYVAGDSGSFPGPDWMPKQAHLADLQAEVAARNLLAELRGAEPEHRFRPELICIVDTLDGGILVYRSEKRSLVFASRLLHWAKRVFEGLYLRRFRRV
ncbi:FAD-dependent oxidoreductase [Thiohalobacter sp. IOR34]|uniref:NAD(P)/FAD-dependent oxidoreductase n=1 Tax=Thiohalobacter sp. IOR34 TaxID=3057176 RepID=UPI0025AF9833|nr:FAD-dependent oxidoreductase [Thiohalobacter sp. IOR34]WJW74415.1 FAD-dependent oxidoreductase [Thiohalobacter sp. IOR34]